MDVMSGIAAISQALSIAKGLREIEKGFDSAEFKLKIADLSSSLADAKLSLADAQTQIETKQAEIDALSAQFRVRNASVEYKGYRYERGADGKPVGYPFCPRCEIEGRMIRTTYTGKVRGEAGCPQCKAIYRYVEDFEYPD